MRRTLICGYSDAAVGRASQFTSAPAPDVRPAWSPDGKRVASRRSAARRTTFTSRRRCSGGREGALAYRRRQDGGGLVAGRPGAERYRAAKWPLELSRSIPTKKPTFIRAGSGDSLQSEFSPDGRWLAYVERRVRPFRGLRRARARYRRTFQVSTDGGAEPHWRRDTGELFYLTTQHWIAAITVPASGTWESRRAESAVPRADSRDLVGSDFTVSPSARFAVNTVQADQTIPPVEVVVNWTPLLGR